VARETLAAKSNAFLGTFAQATPLDELSAGVTPSSILFDWSTLLEVDELELRRTPATADLGRQVSKRMLTRILGETISLAPEGTNWLFLKTPGQPLGSFAVTTAKYSVRHILRERLVIHDVRTAESMPLAKWTRENDAYSITFTQPEYFFGSGALYHRADFATEVDAVRRYLQPEAALANATSEKGEPKKTDTHFPGTRSLASAKIRCISIATGCAAPISETSGRITFVSAGMRCFSFTARVAKKQPERAVFRRSSARD
jgi:hypothetical protein